VHSLANCLVNDSHVNIGAGAPACTRPVHFCHVNIDYGVLVHSHDRDSLKSTGANGGVLPYWHAPLAVHHGAGAPTHCQHGSHLPNSNKRDPSRHRERAGD
jgi:hypothetical protein